MRNLILSKYPKSIKAESSHTLSVCEKRGIKSISAAALSRGPDRLIYDMYFIEDHNSQNYRIQL